MMAVIMSIKFTLDFYKSNIICGLNATTAKTKTQTTTKSTKHPFNLNRKNHQMRIDIFRIGKIVKRD